MTEENFWLMKKEQDAFC